MGRNGRAGESNRNAHKKCISDVREGVRHMGRMGSLTLTPTESERRAIKHVKAKNLRYLGGSATYGKIGLSKQKKDKTHSVHEINVLEEGAGRGDGYGGRQTGKVSAAGGERRGGESDGFLGSGPWEGRGGGELEGL